MTAKRKQDLPVDVYIPFVETLFRDGATLAVGIASQTLVIALVYWKSGNPAYLVIAASLVVIGIFRILSFSRHNSLPPAVSREEARSRENTYILYGSVHAVALGAFCFVAIYFADDSFAELAAVCTALATATAIAGRNYGSPRMVIILIIALTWPISLGFMLRGDPYHIVLGLLVGAVPLHHPQVRRHRPRCSLHRDLRGEEGDAHCAALQPRAQHHVAWPDHAGA